MEIKKLIIVDGVEYKIMRIGIPVSNDDIRFKSSCTREIRESKRWIKMIELKTLKDFEEKAKYHIWAAPYFEGLEDLKQEAIKWVKFRKPKLYGKPICEPKFTAEQVNQIVREVFSDFFNITEEDLNVD